MLASLDEEAAAGVPARSHAPHWKMGRIPAVLIAAAVLVSGSAITAAAATGGFSQLMQLVFEKTFRIRPRWKNCMPFLKWK
ncbi:MAG: hypothetical protein ACLSFT_02095 [Ruminococcus callidus]